jgi:hypothetical protein
LPGGHEAREAHLCQVLGNGRRRFVDDLGQLVDRQFALAQGKNNPDTRSVGEHGKNLNGQFDILAVRLAPAYLLICIHTQIISHLLPQDIGRPNLGRWD